MGAVEHQTQKRSAPVLSDISRALGCHYGESSQGDDIIQDLVHLDQAISSALAALQSKQRDPVIIYTPH